MNPHEREYMIQHLCLYTGWNRAVCDKMDDEKLEEVYNEMVDKG